jgi:hypothetical protein
MHNPTSHGFKAAVNHHHMCAFMGGAYIAPILLTALQELYDVMLIELDENELTVGSLPTAGDFDVNTAYAADFPLAAWLDQNATWGDNQFCEWASTETMLFYQHAATYTAILNACWLFA